MENQQPTAAENFHKQGEAYLSQRKLDEAIASCELAIKIEPGYAPPYKTIGNALQGKGQLDAAENWYKKAIEIKSDWPEVYANLGSIYAKKQEWQPAIEYFQKAISIKPDFAGVYRNLAKVWELAGNHDKAIESQYHALNLEPEKARAEEHISLGDELIKKRRIDLAISCYRNAIKINEKSAAAYQKLGEALKREGNLSEATVCYRKAIELNTISSGDTLGDTLIASPKEIVSSNNNSTESTDALEATFDENPRDTLAASISQANSKGNVGDTLAGVTSSNMGINAEDLEALTMLAEAYISQKKWQEAIAAGRQIIRHKTDAKAYKIIGNAQQASGQINEAIASYTKAIEIQPNFPEAYANLGSIFAQQQQWQRAISAYQKAISIKPDFTGAYRNLAKIFQAINKPVEAAESLYQAMRREPEKASEREYLEVGSILQQNSKTEAAAACYRAAIHLNPNSVEAIYQLGELLNSQEQLEEAIPYYQKVAAIQPANQETTLDANQKLTEIYRKLNRTGEAVEYQYQTLLRKPQATAEEYLVMGNSLLENDKLDLAVNCYQNAVKLNPNLKDARNKMAEVWQQLGRWDEAVAYYQSLINSNPNSAEAYQLLADALVEKGDLDAALEHYQKVKELAPETKDAGSKLGNIYYLQGEELEKEGKKEEAIAAYRRAVELNADVDVVYQKLGEILVEKEEWEEAVTINRKATLLNPDFSWSYNNLGNALKALEKWEEAAAAYRRATELKADFPWSQISLGDCLLKLEKWEEAVPVYRRAIELKPDFVWSYANLGKALWNLGKWEEAIAPLQQALKLEENIPEAYQRLGEALHKRARLDLDEAIKWYRKAIDASPDNIDLYHKALDIAPEDETLYLQLGDALLRQGKGYLAVGFYQVGLQINPDSSEIKTALDRLKSGKKQGSPSLPPLERKEVARPGKFSDSDVAGASRQEKEGTDKMPVLREIQEEMPETGKTPVLRVTGNAYGSWLKANLPNAERLEKMRAEQETFRDKSVITLVMPVFKKPGFSKKPGFWEKSLRETVESLETQVYPYWELWCVTDNVSPKVQSILEEYTQINSKIKMLPNPEPGNYAAGINAALSLAGGEFFGLLDVGDSLTRDALYQVAALLNRYPLADAIYGDEDKQTAGGELAEPYFKPDWSPESLMSRMYVGRFCVYRRDLVVSELMGLRIGFEGAEEYDLLLRLSEKSDKVYHVPTVLYHRLMAGIESSAIATNLTNVTNEAGKVALEEAIARRGEPGRVEVVENHPGFYRVRYEIKDYKRVSIIIPTRNLGDILDRCLESIFEKTTYPNYEVIVIDNGSDEPATKAIFKKWESLELHRFHLCELDIPFNFAKLNNFAVEKASGDYLLFLNNDTEVITPDWIEAMVEYAQREKIGAVGPLLLYPDDTIQHAGVVIGLRSVADHSHRGFKPTDAGYHGQIISVNNYSAVTAACLMCRKEVFDFVGGLDEDLAVAFNDVDFCLKIAHKGYRNVYLPHVSLYHHESKSRGVEDTGEKQRRFQQELQTMKRRWRNVIEEDPCYNPHLSREKDDFSFRVVTDVETNVSLYEKDAEIVGFSIDTPKNQGFYQNASSISIGGWVIGKRHPVTTVKLSCEGELLRDVPANLPRLDVGQANPEYPYAQHCGFWGEMETTEFPPEAKVLVEAVFKDGSHVRLGMVELRCPKLIDG
jgi:tetratricopeptide (TPR) repeat protein/GT2 family glycosyltransferase